MMQAARKTTTPTNPPPSPALDRRPALLAAYSNLDDALTALRTMAVMIPAALVDLGERARCDCTVSHGVDILLNDICRRIEGETATIRTLGDVEALSRIIEPAGGNS